MEDVKMLTEKQITEIIAKAGETAEEKSNHVPELDFVYHKRYIREFEESRLA